MDSRAVAKEVQEQVAAAVHKGHERFRKRQDQVRKGRETVGVAVRAGNQLARAVMPNLPPLRRPDVHLPSVSDLTNPDKLRTHAHDLAGQARATQRKFADQAGQMLATQRKLAGKAVELGTPLVTEGVSRLTRVAGSLSSSRRSERAEPTRSAAVTAAPAESGPVTPAAAEAAEPELQKEQAEPSPTEPSTTKPTTAKASTAKPSTAKPSTAKAGTGKASTAKARTTKPRASRPAKTTTATPTASAGDRTTPKPREAKE
jgi:hypothetical protein